MYLGVGIVGLVTRDTESFRRIFIAENWRGWICILTIFTVFTTRHRGSDCVMSNIAYRSTYIPRGLERVD